MTLIVTKEETREFPLPHLIMKKLDEMDWVLSNVDEGNIVNGMQFPSYGGYIEMLIFWN